MPGDAAVAGLEYQGLLATSPITNLSAVHHHQGKSVCLVCGIIMMSKLFIVYESRVATTKCVQYFTDFEHWFLAL